MIERNGEGCVEQWWALMAYKKLKKKKKVNIYLIFTYLLNKLFKWMKFNCNTVYSEYSL